MFYGNKARDLITASHSICYKEFQSFLLPSCKPHKPRTPAIESPFTQTPTMSFPPPTRQIILITGTPTVPPPFHK